MTGNLEGRTDEYNIPFNYTIKCVHGIGVWPMHVHDIVCTYVITYLTAFTTPRVIPVAKTARGYVIRWFVSPRVAPRVQHFKITVFQLGSNELGDDQITDIPLDTVINPRVRALHITRLTEGYQYHMEVSASVGGVYGPPGAADITF